MCGRGLAHSNEKERGIAVLGSKDGPQVTLSDRHAHCTREVIVSQGDRYPGFANCVPLNTCGLLWVDTPR